MGRWNLIEFPDVPGVEVYWSLAADQRMNWLLQARLLSGLANLVLLWLDLGNRSGQKTDGRPGGGGAKTG